MERIILVLIFAVRHFLRVVYFSLCSTIVGFSSFYGMDLDLLNSWVGS